MSIDIEQAKHESALKGLKERLSYRFFQLGQLGDGHMNNGTATGVQIRIQQGRELLTEMETLLSAIKEMDSKAT